MDFLKDFNKKVDAMENVGGSSKPPRYWFSFGNYILNYIMSGNFRNGVPQGRVTGLTGPSGAGKSYILGNLAKNAQDAGAYVFIIDSEEALSDDFLSKIGVNVDPDCGLYNYKSVVTIPDTQIVVSEFIKGYTKEFGDDENAPKVFIGIDSLDMLQTDSEAENYSKGKFKGDQGQRNKQLKQMLRAFVQDVKGKNITLVVTSQVYQNQDLLNGEGLWIVAQSIRYSMSQIALFTKKKLKADDGESFIGIKLVAQGFKTRFTKPFQKIEIEVPYDTGLDVNFGLLDVAVAQGILTKGSAGKHGTCYIFAGEDQKHLLKELPAGFHERVLLALEKKHDLLLTTDAEVDAVQNVESAKNRRVKKAGVDTTKVDSSQLQDDDGE